MRIAFTKNLLVLSVVAFPMAAQAQKADSKSKSLLESVARNYDSSKNSYFRFVYGSGEGKKVTRSQEGTFISAPDKYRLKIAGVEQIYDGSKIYNISAEDKEITIAKADGKEQTLNPTKYLKSYKKDYNTKYLGSLPVNGQDTELIRLTPVKNNGISYVDLFVNPRTNLLIKIEQFSSDNQVHTLTVKEYKANFTAPAGTFNFDKSKYKNYIITEL